jgi:hypothetical protein
MDDLDRSDGWNWRSGAASHSSDGLEIPYVWLEQQARRPFSRAVRSANFCLFFNIHCGIGFSKALWRYKPYRQHPASDNGHRNRDLLPLFILVIRRSLYHPIARTECLTARSYCTITLQALAEGFQPSPDFIATLTDASFDMRFSLVG